MATDPPDDPPDDPSDGGDDSAGDEPAPVSSAPPAAPGTQGIGTDDELAQSGGGAGGAIGGAIGGVVVCLCAAVGFWFYRKKKKEKEAEQDYPLGGGLQTRARRDTAVGCTTAAGAMAVVAIDANRPHDRPPKPPGPPPTDLEVAPGLQIAPELSIPPLALPLGRSSDGKTIIRGASTLDAAQAEGWRERRADIQRGLSRNISKDSHGGEASPATQSSFGRAAKKVGAKVAGVLGMAGGKAVAGLVRRTSLLRRQSSIPPPPIVAPLSQHALNVCKEVRETEAAYITDMQTVIEVYVRPSIERKILTLDDTQAIFANVEELCRCATVLLELMDRDGDRATVLAHAFIQVTPFFKLYAFYCRNYERALNTLAKCRKQTSGFSEFLNTQAALPQCRGLSLESYLIKPVQRLTKYPLFWKDLLKQVPHSHPDRPALEKADELVRTVSMAVNQNLNDEVSRLKTVQVLKDLGQEWMALIAPHRKLEKEFTATVHVGVRSWNAFGYVLTDLLIICQKGRGNKQIPWLLTELKDVMVNQELALEQVTLTIDDSSHIQGAAAGFGVKPPADVARSLLLNLRLREREGMPPDEEYWLELPDEALAYQLGDVIPSLGADSMRQFQGMDTPRSNAVSELSARLKDSRLSKTWKQRGGNRNSCPRSSKADRRSRMSGTPSSSSSSQPPRQSVVTTWVA